MVDKPPETAAIHIRTLGHFQVRRHDDILTWPTQKTKALFQILLTEPGQLVPTEKLLELLWPSLSPRKAQNNLWVTMSQLRRALQPDMPPRSRSIFIRKHGEGYCFNTTSQYWLDCDEVASHLAAASSTTDLMKRIQAWEAARALFQGDYLEDEPYAEWAQLPRSQWRRRLERLLADLADAYGQNGRFQDAISICHEILRLNNTSEATYRLLMRCHAALGERAAALRTFDRAVQTLQDEIGVEPMPETIELASQIQQLDGDWTVVNKDWAAPPVQPQSSPPFVGRGNEINRLTQLLALSAAGQGQLALISGEPGIGKSRLVEETAIVARQQGCQLLIAHCYQVEQSMPYQPLIDLLSQVMARDASWQRLDPIWLRELVVLVPEMGAAAAASTAAANLADEPDENRQVRLVQAFSHFFAGQADRQKLLLIIEDLHWADAATLQCLHYFARHIDQTPIMLIFTFRADSLSTDADLASTLHSLQRISHATFLSLARLVETDTTALLAQTTDTARFADRLGRWLYKETAGNPFFLISMLQSIREEGLLDAADETDWQTLSQTDPDLLLPQSIRESVLERLRRLSQFDRDCLEWMAVYGRPLTFSTLHDISQQSQMTLLNSLENLVVRQLLFELAGQYDFNHEKIREVVYSDLGAARRGLYHQSIADVLESSVRLSASPEMAANLAYHFERGGNSEKSLTYWMQAGNYALDAYAYSQAARHFERALALSDQPAARMDAYLGLGRSFILQDDHAAAAAIIGQGLSLAERYKDDSRRAKLMYVQAQNASREHRPDGGKPEVEAALEAAEQAGDDYHLAQNLLLLTEVHESRGDLSSAFETASRAQLVSKRLDDYQLQARTLLEIGFQRALRADFDQSANAARKGLKLLTESDDLESIAYAWNILGRALGGRGDYGPALDAFDHSLDAAQKSGDRYLIAQVFNMRGWLHRELGDYDNALAFDEEGVEYARRWNKPSPEISARLNVCLDLLHLGDPKRALRLLEGIDNQVTAGNFGFHSWRWRLRLLYGRGLCCLTLNQPQEVLELAEEGLQKAEQDGIHKYAALNYELKGLALSELGEMAEAVSSLGTAVDLADNIHCQPVRRASRHKLAALYRQTGFEQEAENASAEAARITQEIAATIDDDVLRDTFLRAALPR